jgi:hypothetical protein
MKFEDVMILCLVAIALICGYIAYSGLEGNESLRSRWRSECSSQWEEEIGVRVDGSVWIEYCVDAKQWKATLNHAGGNT